MAKQKLRIIDDPSVKEVYGDTFISSGFDGGAMVITVGVTRFVPRRISETPKDGEHPDIHVTGRLAISPQAAVDLANGLNKMLAVLTQRAKAPEQTTQH